MQCDVVCCRVLQCAVVCCSVLQCVAVCYSVLQCVAVCCSVCCTWQLTLTPDIEAALPLKRALEREPGYITSLQCGVAGTKKIAQL